MARVHYVKRAQRRYQMVPTGAITPVLRRDGTQKVTKRGQPVTRRASVADKSKPLPNLRCDKCGAEIKPGDPYKWVRPKSGPYGGYQRNRCATCPVWKQSELSSSKMADVYAAQEQCEDDLPGLDAVDDIRGLAEALAEQVRSVAEEYRESASNIEDGFGHPTFQSEELEQRADELESWADEIEGVDLEDEPPECEGCPDCQPNEEWDEDDDVIRCEGSESEPGRAQEGTERYEEWIEEQRDALSSVMSECPV